MASAARRNGERCRPAYRSGFRSVERHEKRDRSGWDAAARRAQIRKVIIDRRRSGRAMGRRRLVVVAHGGEIAFPEAGAGKLQDAARMGAPHVVRHRLADGSGTGAFTGKPHDLGQQLFIQYKMYTFHVHEHPVCESRCQLAGAPATLSADALHGRVAAVAGVAAVAAGVG